MKLSAAAVFLALSLLAGRSASAQLIDLSFYSSSQAATPLVTGAAVLGSSGDYWNPVTSASSDLSLKNVAQGTTTATVSSTLPFTNINLSSQGDLNPDLFNNFVFDQPSASGNDGDSIDFGGLADSTTYTVVLYTFNFSGNDGANMAYSVNGVAAGTLDNVASSTYTSTPSDGGLVHTGNYVKFTAETTSGGDLDIGLNTGSGNTTTYFGVSGIQLQAAPEPSTIALLVAGFAGLLFLARRRLV